MENEINNQTNVNEDTEQTQDTKDEGAEKLSFTQEELDKMLQQTADKRVTSALQKAQAKWEEEFKAKLEQEKSEAEKMAKMSSEEKAQLKLEKKLKELEEREANFRKKELYSETKSQLVESNLPASFADFIVKDTAEDTLTNLEAFKQAWEAELQAQIEKHVEDRLRGNTPKKSNTGNKGAMSKKEFGMLSMDERKKIMTEQPDLYKQIFNS